MVGSEAQKLGREPTIRCMAAADLEAVLAIAARSPEAAQWSRAEYEGACKGKFHGWVAFWGQHGRDSLVGFLMARRTGDEMEILNLAVEPALRRRGLAGRMLKAALAFGRAWGVRKAFLEVRESNAAAMAFYRRHGFAMVGRRPRYYSSPLEDALLLARDLP